MKYVALTCALLLGGCAVHKPAAGLAAPDSESIGTDALPPDSTTAALPQLVDSVVVEPHQSLLNKLLGRHTTLRPTTYHTSAGIMPQVGKKSVVSIYYGPATVINTSSGKKAQVAAGAGVSLTSIEKPRAAVAAGVGAVASDYRKQGQRGGAAASGAGATATATTSKGFPWWLLLIPAVGYAAYQINKRFTIF